jgi:transport and Golgi organization protein 2
MCTVTWVHQPGGYHLLCNRDEKRTRGAASGPRLRRCAGVNYLAPNDPDFGGTWIATNELGISLCLLNGESGREAGRAHSSRGLLIPELIRARSMEDCRFLLRQTDLTPYDAFSLALLQPGLPGMVAQWNGGALTIVPGDALVPLTSSSYDPAGVRRARVEEFARRSAGSPSIDAALLYWFHASHGESAGAYSPCMHREDAETVSFSWITVTRDTVRFLYSPAAPCRSSASEQEVLARAA